MEEEYLTIKDIQETLKLGRNTILKLVALPDFPKIKIGRQIRVPKSKFYKYMESYNKLQIHI